MADEVAQGQVPRLVPGTLKHYITCWLLLTSRSSEIFPLYENTQANPLLPFYLSIYVLGCWFVEGCQFFSLMLQNSLAENCKKFRKRTNYLFENTHHLYISPRSTRDTPSLYLPKIRFLNYGICFEIEKLLQRQKNDKQNFMFFFIYVMRIHIHSL